MMTLPKQLQKSLVQKINDYEEEKKMPLLSTMEKMAMEEGEIKGEIKGNEREKELVIRQLNRKFGELNSDLQAEIKALNIDDVERLGEDFLDFSTVDNLKQWLQNLSSY